jgi:molybdopterin-guanine dinucleotide biosynthesis protein A
MSASVTAYTLIILAGGQGRRMEGLDKGLLMLGEQCFVDVLSRRLRCPVPGTDQILISANRHHDEYARMGGQVCADLRPGYQGPLAGLEATLARAPADQPVVIVPCDMPLLPQNLPGRLLAPVIADPAAVAVLHDGQRRQHLCLALWPASALPSVQKHLNRGQRSMAGWLSEQRVNDVSYRDEAATAETCWRNVNESSDILLLPGSAQTGRAADAAPVIA